MTKPQLRDYCDAEFENIDGVLAELAQLSQSDRLQFSTVELAAMATFLHNCYNGIENILKRILYHERVDLKDTPRWHRDLLRTAFQQGIIDDDLHEKLTVYLSFRHFFIHSYSFTLRWEELKPLVRDIDNTVKTFRAAVERYIARHGRPPKG